jgi:hypothetical protein
MHRDIRNREERNRMMMGSLGLLSKLYLMIKSLRLLLALLWVVKLRLLEGLLVRKRRYLLLLSILLDFLLTKTSKPLRKTFRTKRKSWESGISRHKRINLKHWLIENQIRFVEAWVVLITKILRKKRKRRRKSLLLSNTLLHLLYLT